MNTYGKLPVDIGTRKNCTEAMQLLLGDIEDETAELFRSSLICMCTTEKFTVLDGANISRVDVIKKLNDQLEIYADESGHNHFSLFNFMSTVVDDYRQICLTQNVRSKKACMKHCIWRRMSNADQCDAKDFKQNETISRQELRDYLIENHELPLVLEYK